jgi:hypothetical protein
MEETINPVFELVKRVLERRKQMRKLLRSIGVGRGSERLFA